MHEEIPAFLESQRADAYKIRKNVLEIAWYMRGGITLDQAWDLSSEDREIIGEIIESNMEKSKKAGFPII